MKVTNVLVTGSNGQLAQCIKSLKDSYTLLNIFFSTKRDFDITSKKSITTFLSKEKFQYLINCAAYTNVEQAEKEASKAFLVNAEGVKNLAEVCKEKDIILIHISTDYVFDGKKEVPYTEENVPNPINEYGKSKLKGELYIQSITDKYFIIRTSWLYSQYGKNFYKTILDKSNTEKKLSIIATEVGTPTNANDLSKFLLELVESKTENYGIYHFSNLGKATWYDFAEEILKKLGKQERIKLEKTDNYPTFAKRPKYSVLDKEKTQRIYNYNILDWRDSLIKLKKEN
ncbi:dTDP-4-dehydrorhamnose reductase [Aquimarina rubra]|uniref:dTDP-4-dehydrorhamnose reductase n=1 Tax=Aquimarina rubra TaxID=1920033 RepID=A0ABW5LGX5_9FLAO